MVTPLRPDVQDRVQNRVPKELIDTQATVIHEELGLRLSRLMVPGSDLCECWRGAPGNVLIPCSY